MQGKRLVGEITHYFTRAEVAVVELVDDLTIGDEVSIEGATTDFRQRVMSMQIEHQPVEKAAAGDSIGLKVVERARQGDKVYRLQ